MFASVARGEGRPDSDVDIPIDVENAQSILLFEMEDMRLARQDALGRLVDLGLVGSLRPTVRAASEGGQCAGLLMARADQDWVSAMGGC